MRSRQFVWIAVTFTLAILANAGSLQAECDTYWNSRAYDDGSASWCWLSGSICTQCWYDETGDACATEEGQCEPRPYTGPDVQTAGASDLQGASPCELARLQRSAARLRRLDVENLL